jgi:hypothetical protein
MNSRKSMTSGLPVAMIFWYSSKLVIGDGMAGYFPCGIRV